MRSFFQRLPAAFLLGLLLLPPAHASAHVEDNMPDAVAQMEYKILLEFEPNNTVARNKLGMILYRQGKFAEAAAEFERVLAIRRDDPDALDALGLIRTKEQRRAEAIALFTRAIAANPADVMVHYHLALALEAEGRLKEAAAACETALANSKKAPDSPRLRADIAAISDTLVSLRTKLTQNSISSPRN